MEAMKSYELTMAEKLQLLNLRPRSAVEIYLVSLSVANEMVGLEERKSYRTTKIRLLKKILLVNRRMWRTVFGRPIRRNVGNCIKCVTTRWWWINGRRIRWRTTTELIIMTTKTTSTTSSPSLALLFLLFNKLFPVLQIFSKKKIIFMNYTSNASRHYLVV